MKGNYFQFFRSNVSGSGQLLGKTSKSSLHFNGRSTVLMETFVPLVKVFQLSRLELARHCSTTNKLGSAQLLHKTSAFRIDLHFRS